MNESEEKRRPVERRETGGAVAWTAAAVLTVVACVVFVAGDGSKGGSERAGTPANPDRVPVKADKHPASAAPAVEARPKGGGAKPFELDVAREKLAELAKTYLPQAPAYREQRARVRALEMIERDHRDEVPELKAARVELAVALDRGFADGHPRIRELKARVEDLEKRAAEPSSDPAAPMTNDRFRHRWLDSRARTFY